MAIKLHARLECDRYHMGDKPDPVDALLDVKIERSDIMFLDGLPTGWGFDRDGQLLCPKCMRTGRRG